MTGTTKIMIFLTLSRPRLNFNPVPTGCKTFWSGRWSRGRREANEQCRANELRWNHVVACKPAFDFELKDILVTEQPSSTRHGTALSRCSTATKRNGSHVACNVNVVRAPAGHNCDPACPNDGPINHYGWNMFRFRFCPGETTTATGSWVTVLRV
jgi:hypothetical protein